MQASRVTHLSLALSVVLLVKPCAGEVTLALSPPRAAVTLVIYGSADLTLVREVRPVVLPAEPVDVCVDWRGIAVDGSSVALRAPDDVSVGSPTHPPGRRDALCWRLQAATSGLRELQLTYLTSGIDWRPFYRLVIDESAGSAELEGLVIIRNRSGQSFESPEIRLVMGELRLIENLAEAAWKTLPQYKDQAKPEPSAAGAGLSERCVYDVGSLPKLDLEDAYTLTFLPKTRLVGAQMVYRLHLAKYADGVHQVLVFKNTPAFGLGSIPLAAADAEVLAIAANGAGPRNQAHVPYTPVGEECEIDLGTTTQVVAERRIVRQERANFEFDRFGQVEGYDEREWMEVQLRNLTEHPVTFEYTDTVPGVWEVIAAVPYVEEGLNEVIFTIELAPRSEQTLSYRLIKRQGRRVRLGPVRPK